jgi:hypothetical protein
MMKMSAIIHMFVVRSAPEHIIGETGIAHLAYLRTPQVARVSSRQHHGTSDFVVSLLFGPWSMLRGK